MYVTYQLADTSILDTELLGKIVEVAGARKVDVDFIKAFAANIYSECFRFTPLLMGILLAGFYVIVFKRRMYWSDIIIQTAFVIFMLFLFQFSGRWNHRLVASLAIAIMIAIMYYMILGEEIDGRIIESLHDRIGIVVILVLLVSNVGMLLGNVFDYNEYGRSQEANGYRMLEKHVLENKDTLFIYDTFSMSGVYKYRVFEPCHKGQYDNMISCGGWTTNTPITNGILSEYGYENPFEALAAGSENVILIDNQRVQNKVKYLEEHYGDNYCIEPLESIGGYCLYRIMPE